MIRFRFSFLITMALGYAVSAEPGGYNPYNPRGDVQNGLQPGESSKVMSDYQNLQRLRDQQMWMQQLLNSGPTYYPGADLPAESQRPQVLAPERPVLTTKKTDDSAVENAGLSSPPAEKEAPSSNRLGIVLIGLLGMTALFGLSLIWRRERG